MVLSLKHTIRAADSTLCMLPYQLIWVKISWNVSHVGQVHITSRLAPLLPPSVFVYKSENWGHAKSIICCKTTLNRHSTTDFESANIAIRPKISQPLLMPSYFAQNGWLVSANWLFWGWGHHEPNLRETASVLPRVRIFLYFFTFYDLIFLMLL